MGREKNLRRRKLNVYKQKGHQTRRTRGGKKQKRRQKHNFGASILMKRLSEKSLCIYNKKGLTSATHHSCNRKLSLIK